MAQMEAGIRCELRSQGLDRLKQMPRILRAAQARLPRPGRGMKDRGDAISDCLAVAVGQGNVDGKIDAGAGHHLSLERVAMQIDDSRQHQQVAGIDTERSAPMAGFHGVDFAAGDLHRGFKNFSAEQSPAAFDEYVSHDMALRRGECERSAMVSGSYFARKSSTTSFRKSGTAPRRVSWSQSHHASSASRLAMASENRRLTMRAGFSATMV